MSSNEKKWEHRSRHGTMFRCARCDFKSPMIATNWPRSNDGVIDDEGFASDVAEMIGFHAINIHPNLNGFNGYDTISWDIK